MKNYLYKNLYKNKIIFFFIIFTILICNIQARESEEIKYEIVSFSNEIFYEGNNKLVKSEIERLTRRRINFKAQASFNIPVKISDDNLIQKIEDILTDIESFNNIPYYARRTGRRTSLFRDISIHRDYVNENGNRIIIAEVTIAPFNPTTMKFEIIKDKNFIMFRAYNIDRVKYWIVPVVNEERMLILFAGELDNNMFKCYGLGVADTGTFLVLRRVIEEEFNSRTEAIITWFHSLLRTKLSGS
ncbi:MAG: hypothetical protein FWD87_00975 [Spirochaetaceae bacterium]|nr:hypothetical protein [Spirochaetaceae bacterium]